MRYVVLIFIVGLFMPLSDGWGKTNDMERNFRIDTVHIQGDTTYSSTVDIPFTRQYMDNYINEILQPWHDVGYYYANAKILNISLHTDTAIVMTVALSKGPQVRIDRQNYKGLIRSNESVISRYIPVHDGDSLTGEVLRQAETAAAAIDFVRFVPPVIIRPREGYMSADLEYHFEEKQPVTIALGGGYIPDDPTGLVWHLNLKLNNLFGSGRYATLLSERRERGRNRLELGYRQPLFLVGVGKLSIDVATRDYRDQYYEFAIDAGYTVRLQQRLSSGLSLGLRSVEPAVSQPSYTVYTVRYAVAWKRINDLRNPRKGMSLDWTIGYSYRRYRTDSTAITLQNVAFNETRTSFNLKWYYPFFRSFVGHLGVKYLGLETSEPLPPPSELILVGGPGTLRGFRNEQFAVLRTVIATIEPRYRFENGYLFLFYDGAYLNNRVTDETDNVRTDEQYQYGYGIGLALNNNSRYLKLSLGWSKELAFDSPRLSIELVTDL